MKIRFWDRLILFLGAVLTMLSGAALFVAGLQIQGIMEGLPLWVRMLCIVVGLLIVIFGGYLIVFPRRYAVKRHDFVVQRTDNGELRIAVKAIENLVQKCIDLHEEIQVISMNILNSREGVVVELCVSLANNISIPLAIASLQKQIKQYLIASSGIEVKEVRVSVESTQDNILPAPAPEGEEQPVREKEKEKEKRPPLHQRLFGTPEQPAIVPEPPKEEEKEEEAEAAGDMISQPGEALEDAAPEAEEEDIPSLPEEEQAEATSAQELSLEEADVSAQAEQTVEEEEDEHEQ